MSAWEYFVYCIKNTFNYRGRARRSEFWYFTLFQAIFLLSIAILGLVLSLNFMNENSHINWLSYFALGFFGFMFLFHIVLLLAGLSVSVRRLHDTNHSGWWVLLFLLLGGFVDFLSSIFSAKEDIDTAGIIFFLIGLVLWIIFTVVLAFPGTKGANKYGPDPLIVGDGNKPVA